MSKMAVVGLRNAKGPETLPWRSARLGPEGVKRMSQKDSARGGAPGRLCAWVTAECCFLGWPGCAKEMLRRAEGRLRPSPAVGCALAGRSCEADGRRGLQLMLAKEMLRLVLGRGPEGVVGSLMVGWLVLQSGPGVSDSTGCGRAMPRAPENRAG